MSLGNSRRRDNLSGVIAARDDIDIDKATERLSKSGKTLAPSTESAGWRRLDAKSYHPPLGELIGWRSNVYSETLNDRIRHLCALAIMTPDTDIEPVLAELRDSLHEQAQMVRTMAIQAFGTRQPMSSSSSQ